MLEFYEFGDAEHYELATNPGEQTKLVAQAPDRLADQGQPTDT
ncbi:MAG: hypothetical protein NTX48_11965 [Planctomycetales bacterium]|nr:hypothetical protein [Planctomycetales bacterium]